MDTKANSLKHRKVGVLMADGFEMAEYTLPVNALRLAGAHVSVISLRQGRVRGVNLHEPTHRVQVDKTLDQARVEDYDALFIPGGFINPDLLRQSVAVRSFVKKFDQSGKPIATLCHGPWVLASCELMKDRTLTSWPGVRDDMVHAGAIWMDQPVVRDGNWLTSRGPQDFAQFIPALLDFFGSSKQMLSGQSEHLHRPSSPQRSEPPSLVINAMRILPRPAWRGFIVGLIVGGLAMMAQSLVPHRPRA